MKNIFYFFCISIVIFSCKKENVNTLEDFTYNFTEPLNNPFESLDLNCSQGQVTYEYAAYSYSNPIFNPLNPNEIAYLRGPLENGCVNEIWIFNLKTGRAHKVTSSQRVCKLDWSILNWIVFTNSDGGTWKVKPNGSELTKITANANSGLLKCHPNEPKILIESGSPISFGTPKSIIDFEGNTIEAITPLDFNFFSSTDWKDSLLVFPENDFITIYNWNTEELTRVETNEEPFSTNNNIQFLGDQDVLFSTEKSIHKLNLITHEKSLLKANGANDWFFQMDISIDKKTILVQKVDFFEKDDCTILMRQYLSFLNIDGSDERRILIPE